MQATCRTITNARAREVRVRSPEPSGARPSSARDSASASRLAWRAGQAPNDSPVISERPNATARTGRSRPMSAILGKSAGSRDGSARRRAAAIATPRRPPATPMRALSTSSWRARRPVPAPSAERIAISRRRLAARASCRLATLAVAVASSRPTAARKITSAGRTSAVSASSSGAAAMSTTPLDPNTAVPARPRSSPRRARAVPSAAAWRGVAPGRSLATALKIETVQPWLLPFDTAGTNIGSHARVSRVGKSKPGAITATIW